MTVTETRSRDSNPEHDALVAKMTGGMARRLEPRLPEFNGSERLRPDGRPQGEFRDRMRTISNVHNVGTALVALGLPILTIAVIAQVGHWTAVLLAMPVMAIFQNRLFILHHEGAHRLLFSNRRWNDWVGINLFGLLAFGTGSHSYRRAHTRHHRDEFGPGEPDFLLYSFYPIPRQSFRRKMVRDISGVSAWRSLRPRITGIGTGKHRNNSLRFYAGQLLVFALFLVASVPWLYLLLWLIPYVTFYQVLNRLRAIAEHAGMTRSTDRRLASHNVRNGLVARATIVPCGVGLHLAHHVDMGIPFRNLGEYTRVMHQDGYINDDMTWPNYRTLWKALASG